MKKLLLILMALALLTGCAPAAPTEPATEPTEPAPTEFVETIPPISGEAVNPAIGETLPPEEDRTELVRAVIDEQIIWDDVYENHYDVVIRVPEINADWAAEFNARLLENGEALLEETRACAEEGYSATVVSFDYRTSLHDNLLSILVWQDFGTDYVAYRAFVFDVESGQQLTVAQLCRDLLGISYPQFLLATNNFVKAGFVASFGQYGAESEPEFYNEILASIESDTAPMLGRELYLDEEGQLMLVYWAPSMAGASYYPTVMPIFDQTLTTPGLEEAYRWFFTLCDREGSDYDEADREIIYQAWAAAPEEFDAEIGKLPTEQQRRLRAMPETDQ